MAGTETLEDFYRYKNINTPAGLQNDSGHFNVFSMADIIHTPAKTATTYVRRDYYNISLVRGHHIFHYADKSLEVFGSTLMFFNPTLPYKFEKIDEQKTGFFCIFKEAFFSDHIRGQIRDLPVFAPGAKAAYMLDEQQDKLIEDIFDKIRKEINSDYPFKYDLIRSYLMEMIHQGMKMQPSDTLYQHANANARITAVFNDLLERQFPIDSTSQQFRLRSASDFAEQLNVHVNHLNRAIRLTTGKTTTTLISERLLSEAKALLNHTDWNIAEISYCLGFEEPAHFNNFFKKKTNATPSSFRNVAG